MISLEEIDQVHPVRSFWTHLGTLFSHQVCPDWYRDAKFGMFIHWGLQCTCLWFRMVFAKYVYTRESLLWLSSSILETRPALATRISFLFYSRSSFDPASWLDLFQKRGAQYLFQLRSTTMVFRCMPLLSPYNSLEMGPRRDVLGAEGGSRKRGLHFCTSSHRAEHQFFFSMAKEFTSDIPQEVPRDSLYWPADQSPRIILIWLLSLIQVKNSWKIGCCEPVNWCGTTNQSSYILTGGSSMRVSVPTWCAFWLIITI